MYQHLNFNGLFSFFKFKTWENPSILKLLYGLQHSAILHTHTHAQTHTHTHTVPRQAVQRLSAIRILHGMCMARVKLSRMKLLCSLSLTLSMFSRLHRTNVKHDKLATTIPVCLWRLQYHNTWPDNRPPSRGSRNIPSRAGCSRASQVLFLFRWP